MSTQRFTLRLTVLGALCFSLLSSCATKKYVVGQVTPVNTRVQGVENRNTEQDKQLEALETESSKTRENLADVKQSVNGLDTQLKSTTETAKGAATAASQAQQQAADARMYATTRADGLQHTIENYDKFKLSETVNVHFDTGRSELTKDTKAALDEVAQKAGTIRRFVLEVQGFTDNTGGASINIPLSQQRAEAVVRYLTVDKSIPLRNVHLIGAGSSSPVADNKTRAGRKENRRVEIRVFAPEAEVTAADAQLR
jgi:outer membrane protein OmpA-like peptidoglycan-associated protein